MRGRSPPPDCPEKQPAAAQFRCARRMGQEQAESLEIVEIERAEQRVRAGDCCSRIEQQLRAAPGIE